jgi:hypothetical protein
MDRQTLRDWFIGSTRTALKVCSIIGRADQLGDWDLSNWLRWLGIVEAGPDREKDGVVR